MTAEVDVRAKVAARLAGMERRFPTEVVDELIEINTLILRAAIDDHTDRVAPVQALSARAYTFGQMAPDGMDGRISGTWDEVRRAWLDGFLTQDEYDTVQRAVHQRRADDAEPDGPVDPMGPSHPGAADRALADEVAVAEADVTDRVDVDSVQKFTGIAATNRALRKRQDAVAMEGALTLYEVARLVGTDRKTVSTGFESGLLFGFRSEGTVRYPAWQFDPKTGKAIPVLGELLVICAGRFAGDVLAFDLTLRAPQVRFGGESALDLFARNDYDLVIQLLRSPEGTR